MLSPWVGHHITNGNFAAGGIVVERRWQGSRACVWGKLDLVFHVAFGEISFEGGADVGRVGVFLGEEVKLMAV